MKYADILGEEQIRVIATAEHLTMQQKTQIMKTLHQDIDERFSGFKHCITSL